MKSIKPASQALRRQAKQRWDKVAKPLGSLGVLEEDIIRIAGKIYGSIRQKNCKKEDRFLNFLKAEIALPRYFISF